MGRGRHISAKLQPAVPISGQAESEYSTYWTSQITPGSLRVFLSLLKLNMCAAFCASLSKIACRIIRGRIILTIAKHCYIFNSFACENRMLQKYLQIYNTSLQFIGLVICLLATCSSPSHSCTSGQRWRWCRWWTPS